jgi:hypothetical protein
MIGTLVFRHNGREIRHQDCLYNKSYSNLFRGQRIGSHVLKVNRNGAELKLGRKIIYKMIRDTRGGLWVVPDNSMEKVGRIEAVKELHERYGHISYDTLRSLPECRKFEGKPRCEACKISTAAKPRALPRMQPIRTSRVSERLHCDLVGPINPKLRETNTNTY